MFTDEDLKAMSIQERNMVLDAIAHEQWLCEMEEKERQSDWRELIRF